MDVDELGDALAGLNDDPVAADRVVSEMLRRDDENQRLEDSLSSDAIAEMDDFDRYTAWVRTEQQPHIRARIEQQWLSEGVNPNAMTGTDSFGVDVGAHDAPDLSDDDRHRLSVGWRTLSWRKYAALEESLITNPAHRTDMAEIKARGTVKDLEVELKQEYDEYLNDLHLRAEAACRGSLLNRKGNARLINPNEILRGNIVMLKAYASDELRSFLAKEGGGVSYSRWLAEHKQADTDIKERRFHDRDVVA